MLREFAEAVGALTAEHLLVLEVLHWSDHATLDLIAWLARRREPSRLLLVGTYRPVDVIVREHPLQAVHQDLMLHGQYAELRLEGLAEGAVAACLGARFPGRAVATQLAHRLLRNGSTKRSCIGSRGSCCFNKHPPARPRGNAASRRLWPSPAADRPDPGNCGRP